MRKLKNVGLYLLIQIIVLPILILALVYYGPYTNIRDMIVTTSMTTMSHQYFATWFLSDETINEILEETRPPEIVEEQSLESIVVNENATDGIELIDVSSSTYNGYLLIVNDPSRVKLGVAPRLGVVGATVGQIVEYYDAIAGINASGFADDALGTGGVPDGLIISNNEVVTPDETGYYSFVGFNEDNIMVLSNSMSYYNIMNMGVRDACTFGPVIVYNGYGMFSSGGGYGLHPRTAIGQRKTGEVLLLVIDGRSTKSLGATIKNVQDIMLEYGAYNAFNLDGGASTTMVYNDEVVNSPSDIMGERYVPCAWIVTK
ncbi:MAG: phosphodiester glycosidase family protein [Clostridia bacterium]|nr:phosphodiester glycosidase family protein [Clostridia bacterium]